MTAEVIVMNRLGMAVATDSAASVRVELPRRNADDDSEGRHFFEKVYVGNKLFTLSKHKPVAVMIYGYADYMRIPWETLVKMYRSDLGAKSFARLSEYGDDVFRFLRSSTPIKENSDEHYEAFSEAYGHLEALGKEIIRQIDAELPESEGSEEKTVRNWIKWKFKRAVKAELERVRNLPKVQGLPKDYSDQVLEAHRGSFDWLINHKFPETPIVPTARQLLLTLLAELFSRELDSFYLESTLGGKLVLMGYGTGEVFPSAIEYSVRGVVCGHARFQKATELTVNAGTRALIRPFAQRDMVEAFMFGIDTNLEYSIIASVRKILSDLLEQRDSSGGQSEPDRDSRSGQKRLGYSDVERLTKEFKDRILGLQLKNHHNPIVAMVEHLSLGELAEVARTLVNLTVFKRRVSKEPETVGGAIDVAVISKGDGFVWIERKHYFSQEYNPTWAAAYREERGGQRTHGTDEAPSDADDAHGESRTQAEDT